MTTTRPPWASPHMDPADTAKIGVTLTTTADSLTLAHGTRSIAWSVSDIGGWRVRVMTHRRDGTTRTVSAYDTNPTVALVYALARAAPIKSAVLIRLAVSACAAGREWQRAKNAAFTGANQ